MKALANTSHITTALQLIQHIKDGMSVVDTYHMVWMPRSSFLAKLGAGFQ